MKSRLFCLLLSVTLIFGLLPTAFASGVTAVSTTSGVVRMTGLDLTGDVNYTTTTGETTTVDATATNISNSGEGWQWDATTKQLTLSGAYILCADDVIGLRLPDGAKIVLQDGTTNVIRSADGNPAYPPANAGIWAEGSLEFAGTGSLTVTSGTTWDIANMSCGIYLAGEGSTLLISGGRLTIASGDTGTQHTAGIYSDYANMVVAGGTVTASGGNTTIGGNSYGIYIAGALSVNGGTLNAISGTSSWNSYGILPMEGMTVTGGTTYAKGGWATEGTSSYSYGIFTIASLTMNNPDEPGTHDGKVYAFGGVAANSYGIFFGGGASALNVYSGTLMATGDKASSESYGVYNNGSTTLAGGITVFQASIGSTIAHATNIDPGFGTSTVTTVTPVGLAPGNKACDQEMNVFAPSGAMHLRTENLNIVSNNVTQGNLEAEGYHWDADTKMLTLDGICIANTDQDGIILPPDATVVLNDGSMNLIKRIGSTTTNQAIYGYGNLTIQGTGTLFALGGYTTTESRAIYLEPGNLNILSGEILAIAGNSWMSEGIMTMGGSVNVSGGRVVAMSGSTPNGTFSQGIRSGSDINLSGSARVMAIGNLANSDSTGMIAGVSEAGNISISSLDTIVISSRAGTGSVGLYCPDGDLSLTGAGLTVLSGFAAQQSYGIKAIDSVADTLTGNVTFGNGDVQIIAGSGTDRSYGLYVDRIMQVDGCALISLGGTTGSTGSSFGINVNFPLELIDGVCLGAAAHSQFSTGIAGPVHPTGGLLIGAGGLATEESCGIQSCSHQFAGGTVWGIGGSAPFSRGIFGYTEGITVETGIVYAVGGQSGGSVSYGLQGPSSGGTITLIGGKIIARTLDQSAGCSAMNYAPVLTGGSVTLRDGAFDGTYALYIEACDVSFNANGGTAVATQHPDYDELITGTTTTTRSGYHFGGWRYQDPATSQWILWNIATDKVHGDLTLTALWQKPTSACTVGSISKMSYTGTQLKPLPLVKDGTKILVKDVDYTLTYGTNVAPGKGTVTITGKTNYYGSVSKTFYIVPKSIAAITLNLNETYPTASLRYRDIKATWPAAVGASGYLVKYRKYPTTTWSSVYVTKNSWSMLSAYSGALYYVQAIPYVTIDGVKQFSATYSPAKPIYTLKAPSVHLHKSGTTSIIVDWNNIVGETGYKIYRKTGSTGTWAMIKTIASTTAYSWTDTGRTVGKAYYYQVRAYRTVNNVIIYGPLSNTTYLIR